MEWNDHGIVLASRPHGETGLVASLLTRSHGRHAGFVPGGVSRRARAVWQPGNLVEVAWRARLAEQLGNFTAELREPHPAMFEGFQAFLAALGHAGWPAIYVRLELGLLQELGFGLDLEKCAVTGATDDLAFVSPKSGRAVSRGAAEPYRGKLLVLPTFLSTGGLPSDDVELRLGFDLTGYFLERHVFWPHNKPLPPARARFMETLLH